MGFVKLHVQLNLKLMRTTEGLSLSSKGNVGDLKSDLTTPCSCPLVSTRPLWILDIFPAALSLTSPPGENAVIAKPVWASKFSIRVKHEFAWGTKVEPQASAHSSFRRLRAQDQTGQH